MSDTIRALMRERQTGRPAGQSQPGPTLSSLYEALVGQSITGRMLDQYGRPQVSPNQPMSPMISSVPQLDR